MCKFLSALWTREDRLYCNPLDDSHEHLISAAGLRDDRLPGAADWVRVEYVPGADPRVLPWAYSLDETARPDWFDAASEARCCSALRAIAEQILAPIADGEEIVGGCRVVFEARVIGRGSRLLLYGRSRAELYGRSRAELYGRSRAELHDASHADLYGRSRADLYGRSGAELHDASHAALFDASRATLHGRSRADLHDASSGATIDDRR